MTHFRYDCYKIGGVEVDIIATVNVDVHANTAIVGAYAVVDSGTDELHFGKRGDSFPLLMDSRCLTAQEMKTPAPDLWVNAFGMGDRVKAAMKGMTVDKLKAFAKEYGIDFDHLKSQDPVIVWKGGGTDESLPDLKFKTERITPTVRS